MDASDLSEHASLNRDHWNAMADEWVASGEDSWARSTPKWGAWELPDEGIALLPDDMAGMRAIELGCGTGYVSAWMARRGAEVVGIDVSEGQLATARRLAAEHGVDLTLHHGSAETVPEPDASFDFAFSEYGAALWCDPYVWIPEAARLLKPGGRLAFLTNHPMLQLCYPPDGDIADERLHRPYFGLHRLDWSDVEVDPGGVEFNLPISAWMSLFDDAGFRVDEFLELQVPDEIDDDRYSMTSAWAKQWPSEMAWKLTRR
ncbi:class I SAM-dependent methyltransferase [Actinospongicola halichondriae]|uniref:class I SAM-dependent methyltransferase n=1 Tax=Actinospongicola halichondriae TaxID=3236844 RepID=UPI003D50A5F7